MHARGHPNAASTHGRSTGPVLIVNKYLAWLIDISPRDAGDRGGDEAKEKQEAQNNGR